jgi:phosphatidylglycerophosphate synthase
VLGLLRIGAACLLPSALHAAVARGGGWLPLALAAGAALSDYVDGPLARRGPPRRHGAALDNLADIALVLAGTGAGAMVGLISWTVPAAIGLAFAAYALAAVAGVPSRPARTRLGHAAGVLNYALVLLIAGAAAPLRGQWMTLLQPASLVVVAVNLAAVVNRLASRSVTLLRW